jgi:predicted dehydrogenase
MKLAIPTPSLRKPRLGFLGAGWIGLNRMQALRESEQAEISAICDLDSDKRSAALKLIPEAKPVESLDDLLSENLDGVVIATPSAQHAGQALRALQRGIPVFCQKPLARNGKEVREIIEAARKNDCLLGVDLSYRYTQGMEALRKELNAGSIGRPFAIEATFHNAYGPDKAWFYDRKLSGGGCLMDLGIHLADLILWLFDFPEVKNVRSGIYSQGLPLKNTAAECGVEDFFWGETELGCGVKARLSCSWKMPLGMDAFIELRVFGSGGSLHFKNINGSYYDFAAQIFRPGGMEILASPPDSWGPRAALAWVKKLQVSPRFCADCQEIQKSADLLDALYGNA